MNHDSDRGNEIHDTQHDHIAELERQLAGLDKDYGNLLKQSNDFEVKLSASEALSERRRVACEAAYIIIDSEDYAGASAQLRAAIRGE